jgi:hypothetical protein
MPPWGQALALRLPSLHYTSRAGSTTSARSRIWKIMTGFVPDMDRLGRAHPIGIWALTELVVDRTPFAGLFEWYRREASEAWKFVEITITVRIEGAHLDALRTLGGPAAANG